MPKATVAEVAARLHAEGKISVEEVKELERAAQGEVDTYADLDLTASLR